MKKHKFGYLRNQENGKLILPETKQDRGEDPRFDIVLTSVIPGYHDEVVQVYKTIGPGRLSKDARQDVKPALQDEFDTYVREATLMEIIVGQMAAHGMPIAPGKTVVNSPSGKRYTLCDFEYKYVQEWPGMRCLVRFVDA